jgi:hypothetical protein
VRVDSPKGSGSRGGAATELLPANSKDQSMTVVSVIVGSTREGRFSEKPARWILQQLKKR